MVDHRNKLNNEDTRSEGIPTARDGGPVGSSGEQIGQYKLLRILGEGGYGIAYLDKQQTVKRRVALKVIKPSIDTKQVTARFESERQALAMMDHANIAKVLYSCARVWPPATYMMYRNKPERRFTRIVELPVPIIPVNSSRELESVLC
jgi:serine/threonine protein kinase